jgi:hypothetical protein
MFNDIEISCEQGIFTLLTKGVKYPNSFLQPVHIVFLWNIPEDHPSLRAINDKVESCIPTKGNAILS